MFSYAQETNVVIFCRCSLLSGKSTPLSSRVFDFMKSFFLGVPIFAFSAQVAFPAIVNDAEYGKIYELESFSVRSMGGASKHSMLAPRL